MSQARRRTSTSSFGVSKRESHDASRFYDRFVAPTISTDNELAGPVELATSVVCGDARSMDILPDNAVALIVTSPPYFAGKTYEAELGLNGIPASYLEYLELLRDVFRECVRVLEPGGRIAVNVANLGRKPFRSLASDVTTILQDDLGLLLRGEVIWQKGAGASGSCAWGSYCSPANPTLRDLTERVIIASKGRFDRALSAAERKARGLPHHATISGDEFMAATLDVWELAAERATRVGHPAPFPVELPERLIDLYTYEGDLVVDPFCGSGTTLVAAARRGRRGLGYDLDPSYVDLALTRLATEGIRTPDHPKGRLTVAARATLVELGYDVDDHPAHVRGAGAKADLVATNANGVRHLVRIVGGDTVGANGLARKGLLFEMLGWAAAMHAAGETKLLVVTSHLPPPGSEGAALLRAASSLGVGAIIAIDPATSWSAP